LKTLRRLRGKAIFPLLLLVWGVQVVFLYALMGLEFASDKLEQWESPSPCSPSDPATSAAEEPSLRRAARTIGNERQQPL